MKVNILVKREGEVEYITRFVPQDIVVVIENVFNNSIFTFIDEVADSIYIVSGIKLLAYIIEHADDIQQSEANPKKSWILIPKKDIVNLIIDNPNSIIRYNKKIAKLFATNRNESLYREN